MQIYEGWDSFKNMPIIDKMPYFKHNDNIFDVIYTQQFDRNYLDYLFSLADKIRKIAKNKSGKDFLQTILSDKRALLFFVQPSTRTFLSFLTACQVLGVQTCEIRDPSTSSEVKGESVEDMIRTFSSYVDLIITRHVDEGFAERAAWVLNTHAKRSLPVINAGSGKDEHPTQALLDIYTIQRAYSNKGGISGKNVILVGDLKRGRTVRSLCKLLALYDDIKISFVSPKEFAMREDVLDFLTINKVKFEITDNLKQVLPLADVVYATRLQDEHDAVKGESRLIDLSSFSLQYENLRFMKEDSVIMHPFPRRNEIDVKIDNDKRAHYWKQARNGMWIRIALILKIFQRDKILIDWL